MAIRPPSADAATLPPPALPQPRPEELRLSEVVSALTVALDVSEGQPAGHALRTCVIGMRIGDAFQLDARSRSDLYYALLLKDLGCSSNAAKMHHLFGADELHVKRAYKTADLRTTRDGVRFALSTAGNGAPLHRRMRHFVNVALGRGGGYTELIRLRAVRGAAYATDMGFSKATADAIRALDEHYDGGGYPTGLSGEEIPLLARIACLAQTVEIFYREGGPDAARAVVAERNATWFDPRVVAAFDVAQRHPDFWTSLASEQLGDRVVALEPEERRLLGDDHLIDRLAVAFARVIDAKSPWTFRHSERVRDIALGAASQVNGQHTFTPDRVKRLSRAALLHDIGKLGVSNALLDKPGRLSDDEMAEVRRYPALGERILAQVQAFRDLAAMAGEHLHGKNGAVYSTAERLGAAQLLHFDVRLLAVADRFEALTSDRPHRPGKSVPAALAELRAEAGEGVDAVALGALERFLATPEAQPILAPKPFDANGIVVVT